MRLMIIPGVAVAVICILAVLPGVSAGTIITATGTVTDARGDPVPGANVTLVDDFYHSLGVTTTDANGNFRFESLETNRSCLVKAIVAFAHGDNSYGNQPENSPWYNPSGGLINFQAEDLRLHDYPVSDHGYAWGIVVEGADSRPVPDGTVYLSNDSVNLSMAVSNMGSFLFEVCPGEYEIFAVHDEGPYHFDSKRTRITVNPAHDYLHSASINLVIGPMNRSVSPPAAEVAAAGIVTGANGDPVAGANVSLVDDFYHVLGTTVTDMNGSFVFRDLDTNRSCIVKALVTYVRDGQKFSSRPENAQWHDASQGPFSFQVEELRLYDYPVSDHGYVWGIVINDMDYDRALDSTVYLYNNSVNLSARTGSTGAFMFGVYPGEYEIYAVHDDGAYCMVSNQTKISVSPVHDYLQAAPMTLVANQKYPAGVIRDRPSATYQAPHAEPSGDVPSGTGQEPSAGSLKLAPLAVALVIGLLAIVAGWSFLIRKS